MYSNLEPALVECYLLEIVLDAGSIPTNSRIYTN